jgi:CheY-like chemotaxis protein
MDKLRPHGPVSAIAVSGFGMENDVRKSREVGFLAHLTKPIDFNRLENLIVETLGPTALSARRTSSASA